jgi:diaminopimelate epimerase
MQRATVGFEKYHGTGNDFLVVDATQPVPDREAFAAAYCDRETGVGPGDDADAERGADGVLFLALEEYRSPRVVTTLVQPDGSVAPGCGNGTRVAAAWAAGRTDAREFMIDTPAGTRRAVVDEDGVTVESGVPSFDPRDVGLRRADPLVDESVGGLDVTAVDAGTPHAVAFLADPGALAAADPAALAPPVRHADVFEGGANVTLAAVADDGVHVRTFERGVERETGSSGTGAVAAVAAARRHGSLADAEDVSVHTCGGVLRVTVPEAGPARLWGPTHRSFSGEVPPRPPGPASGDDDGRGTPARARTPAGEPSSGSRTDLRPGTDAGGRPTDDD